MAFGFKGSLFGFKKSDVIRYIESESKQHSDIERALSLKVDELTRQLDAYKAKEEKLEKLSVAIGKLYILAEMNSRRVMDEAEKTAAVTAEKIKDNLSAIDSLEAQLNTIRDVILRAGDSFNREVSSAENTLSESREAIEALSSDEKTEPAENSVSQEVPIWR